MKFSGSFTAFVVASIATANLAAAAPISSVAARDVEQSNSQSTSQASTGPSIQSADSNQDNLQDVDVNKNNRLNVGFDDHSLTAPSYVHNEDKPVTVVKPVHQAPAPAPVPAPAHHGGDGSEYEKQGTGDILDINALNGNKANAGILNTGNQANRRAEFEHQGTGDILDLNAINDNAANAGILNTGPQSNLAGYGGSHRRAEFEHQGTGDILDLNAIEDNAANLGVLNTGPQANIAKYAGLAHRRAEFEQQGTGDILDLSAINDNAANLGVLNTGPQSNLAAYGGFHHRRSEYESQGTGDILDLNAINDNSANVGALNTAPQTNAASFPHGFHKRGGGGLFAQAFQGASADGHGGASLQGQSNTPVLSGAGNSLTTGGAQGAQNDGTGGQIQQGLQQLLGRQLSAFGQQGASANGFGGSSLQGQSNRPVLSGAGNSLTTGGAQGSQNDGTGGSIEQGLKQVLGRRQLSALGQQGASANGYGGSSAQGQSNRPVLSGAGNSLTTGGSQFGENNGQGGNIVQKLGQQLGARQLFAAGKQQGSADGFGGSSLQGQSNAPVLSGAGNSLTAGGYQGATNNGQGGSVGQEFLQKLGGGLFRRQGGAFGSQEAGANGFGGFSSQFQSNRPVVSGFGNSVTTGGAQQSSNNGQGGSIEQGLKQLLGRGVQGSGQGVGQGTYQSGKADAVGGNAFLVGANGPVAVDGSAQAGQVNQGSASKQAAGQSATQAQNYQAQNNFGGYPGFYRRQYGYQSQGLGQGIGQGTVQEGSASAQGGNAFVAGANGPTWINNSAKGGVVNQGSTSAQDAQQSATQGQSASAQNNFYHPAGFWARGVDSIKQGTNQGASQQASSDAKGGNVVVGPDHDHWFWAHHPDVYAIDTSAKSGPVSQNVDNDQVSGQKAVQARGFFQGQSGSADAVGGDSYDNQVNGGTPLSGVGLTSTQGGPQVSNNSGVAGKISQLLNPPQ